MPVNLNVVNIDTNYSVAPADAGFGTVAYLNADDSVQQPKLEKFTAMNQITNYDQNSPVYKAANYYFNGGADNNVFEVISGNTGMENSKSSGMPAQEIKVIINALERCKNDENQVQIQSPAFDGLLYKSIAYALGNNEPFPPFSAKSTEKNTSLDEENLSPTLIDLKVGNEDADDYFKSKKASTVNDAIDYIINNMLKPQLNTANKTIVGALSKFYNSGAEYYLFNVDNSDTTQQQLALKLADYVESQSSGVLMIDINTKNDNPDLSWTKPMANDRSVMVVSSPNDNMLGAALLGIRASQAANANIEMVHSLNGIKPQDSYQFTASDYIKYYAPYNVATYAYRNGIPMLTSGDSDSGYQWSNMITRDYLNYQVINRITALLIANNGNPGITYNQQGVQIIIDQIRLVLSDAQRNGLITSYHVGNVDFNKIPQSEIAQGQLNGLNYDWSPAQNISGATFHQTINLPNLQ